MREFASSIKTAIGVEELVDMGAIYNGKYGANDCTMRSRIETYQGMFYICIDVDLSSGASFKNVKVVKWAYSESAAQDLDAPLHDLQSVLSAARNNELEDPRSFVGRCFDKITGRKYLGEYVFQSPLKEARQCRIKAIVVDSNGGPAVTLVEKCKHSDGIYATMPLEALASVVGAWQAWRKSAG